ncbi:MAG: hypothetical protein ABS46_04740 [Cytophagaceae bacterium SCN 52-12]|nr:MAG: hypothetical protein ABS46_04740 [Cytophagaceae bacterium SCN 52-12]
MKRRFPSGPVQAFLIIMTGLAFSSCSSSERQAAETVDREAFIALGDSLSLLAQKTLLQNVSGAIAKGGAAHAVAFCNLRAMPLTDSIAYKNAVTIRRVTDKARNSANALSGEREIALFRKIQDSLQSGSVQPHYLLEDESGRTVYYKPILLAMPTCLQCHGAPGKDIEAATLAEIKEKYPDDEATGYIPGQLRGLWKITAAP